VLAGWKSQKDVVQRDLIMIKNCLFAVALLSLALASGCAQGGSGVVPSTPTVVVATTGINPNAIYVSQSVTLTAKVSNSSNTAVTWSLSGAGTLTPVTPPTTPATATYVAPATAALQITVTATSVADNKVSNTLGITVVDVTTDVTPATLSVGTTGGTGGGGLTQQFTAVAVPDDAPQTFTWTCNITVKGVVTGSCANFVQDANVSGLAYYTAADSCSGVGCIQISAASTVDPAGCTPNPKYCTTAAASLVTSRVSGTYAFRFYGYDSSSNATAVAGTFTASNGTITSGVEDELTSSGWAQNSITGGSYSPTKSDTNNSNNAGTLTLTLPSGVYPNQYQVVLDGAGELKMIESDGHGTGSGIAQQSAASKIFTGVQTYAFGFTGVDSKGNRVGYVGVLPMNGGSSSISGGQMDVNDNGNSSNSVCGTPPCTVTGTYQQNANGSWHMALTSPVTMGFDFFIASGTASKTNPLTFYAISTDPAANPAVLGTMVLQDSSQTYNNAAFNGSSVSALTGTGASGVNTNVSLTLGSTDGKGNFSGQFDQNNAGTILSSVEFPPTGSNNYTYAATGTNGRYTFNMLGNPLPFVLYASGQNRGFLLDQNSSSVMTGRMDPQGKGNGFLAGSELPGTYAAATTGSGNSGVDPIAANLLLTWTNTGTCTSECVNGTQYDSVNYNPLGVPLAGAYTIFDIGNGTIALTGPPAQNYVIYGLDTSGCTSAQNPVCAIQDFLMMDVDKTNPNAAIIFAQQ